MAKKKKTRANAHPIWSARSLEEQLSMRQREAERRRMRGARRERVAILARLSKLANLVSRITRS